MRNGSGKSSVLVGDARSGERLRFDFRRQAFNSDNGDNFVDERAGIAVTSDIEMDTDTSTSRVALQRRAANATSNGSRPASFGSDARAE